MAQQKNLTIKPIAQNMYVQRKQKAASWSHDKTLSRRQHTSTDEMKVVGFYKSPVLIADIFLSRRQSPAPIAEAPARAPI